MTIALVMDPLSTRRDPVQKRSRERVELILDITAKVLTEDGLDAVKPTEIARRANIKLASLYRYFPNKNAILKALALRLFEKARPNLELFLEEFDLTEGIEYIIDAYANFYRYEPGYAELWSGLQAIPELQQLEMDDLIHNARLISERAKRELPGANEETLWVICVMITRTCRAILRLSLTVDDHQSETMLRELKNMVKGYVTNRLQSI